MICRIWHGSTTPENADVYEASLRSEILPWIESRHMAGFHGIKLLHRPLDDAVEFAGDRRSHALTSAPNTMRCR
jgi:hypothetical protein